MSLRILATITMLCIARTTSAQAPPATWKRDLAFVIVHRSANFEAPENSVPAFEVAVRQGADGVETDIRKTRDGVFVIYHDDWVLMQRGPAGKIEEMTLAETQTLDLGDRFGARWRGLHPPLFEDLLRFAKANGLRLFLDIKTPGTYDEIMRIVRDQDALPLIHTTGGQVPEEHFDRRVPWIRGWNYDQGGEEDPERMQAVIAQAQPGEYGIMCDDARSIVRALGRKPELRPLAPFISTMAAKLRAMRRRQADVSVSRLLPYAFTPVIAAYPTVPAYAAYPSMPAYLAYPSTPTLPAYPSAPTYSAEPGRTNDPADPIVATSPAAEAIPDEPVFRDLGSASTERRRAACLTLARTPDRTAIEPLLALAERDPDYAVRQDACWALGSIRDDRTTARLLRIAQTPYDQKTAAQTEYRDFFLKIAAGCALARLRSPAGRAALRTLLNSPAEADRSAAAAGVGAFGGNAELPMLVELADSRRDNDGFPASFVAGYLGRFGAKAVPVYLAALARDDVAKYAVFGLAAIGPRCLPALARLDADPLTPAVVRHRADLVRGWIRDGRRGL